MSKQVRLRRGTTAQHSSFTGAQGEVTVDTDKKVVVVHDGSTAGGVPMFPSTGGTISGSTTFGAGLKLNGPAALGDTAAREWSYEHPATRYYFGDGTGYWFALSKRVGGATTDLFTLSDSGALSTAGTVSSGATNVGFEHYKPASTTYQYLYLANASGYAIFGTEGSSAALITGASAWDAVVRGKSGIAFSANDGTSLHARLDSSGNATVTGNILAGGVTGVNYHAFRRDVTPDVGEIVLNVLGQSGAISVVAYGVSLFGAAGANTAFKVGCNAITGRSINAGGTVNVSGADYAEYEWNNGLLFYKGEIVGFKLDGTLTNKFSESIRFAVKSTNPSFVGGDTWGNSEAVGERPVKPVFVSPEYTGISQPEEVQNTITEESTEEEIAAYNAALAEYNQLLEQFNSDQETYQELVQEARKIFDEETIPAYEADLAKFQERLEAARRTVDRIAYAGKVPCNVQGAQAGDYIIPTAGPNDSIVGISTNDPTFSQYKKAVGRVNKILEDGRAEIAVMIH